MGLRGGSFYESRILFWLRCSGNSNPGTERDGTQMLSSIVARVSLHSHYTDVCLSQSEREREGERERWRERETDDWAEVGWFVKCSSSLIQCISVPRII
jgi:hypothetical protein